MTFPTPEDFRKRDIYIDYPFEHAMFRWEKETKSVYTRFYGKREHEIDQTSEFFYEALVGGREITRDAYFVDYPSYKAVDAVLRLIRWLRP